MLILTRWIVNFLLKMKMEERIICSAIWFDDDIARANQNVISGFVVAGLRHSDCFRTASVFDPEYKYNYRSKQGFLTSGNRFVDRKEALSIAISARQVKKKELHNPLIGLFSEDLY